jgi:hypothetical protein
MVVSAKVMLTIFPSVVERGKFKPVIVSRVWPEGLIPVDGATDVTVTPMISVLVVVSTGIIPKLSFTTGCHVPLTGIGEMVQVSTVPVLESKVQGTLEYVIDARVVGKLVPVTVNTELAKENDWMLA